MNIENIKNINEDDINCIVILGDNPRKHIRGEPIEDIKQYRRDYMKKYRESEKYKKKIEEYQKTCIRKRKIEKESNLEKYTTRLDMLLNHKVIPVQTYDKIKKVLENTKKYPGRTNVTKINLLMSLYDHYKE